MIKLFNSTPSHFDSIVTHNVTKNILNIVMTVIYVDNYYGYTSSHQYHILVKVDMDKRVEVASYKLDFTPLKLIDDEMVAVSRNRIEFYDIDTLQKIKYVDLYDLDFDDFEDMNNIMANNFEEAYHDDSYITIHNLYKLKGSIYYCLNIIREDYNHSEYEGEREINNISENKYVFKKLGTNETLMIVTLFRNEFSLSVTTNGIMVELPFKECSIFNDDNTLIFLDSNESLSYMKINLNTMKYEIKNVSDLTDTSIENKYIFDLKPISDSKLLCLYGEEPGLHNHRYGKDLRTKIIYDLVNDTSIKLKYDKYIMSMTCFNYNDKKYYVIINEDEEYTIYIDEDEYFTNISDNNINKDKIIKIGTENENVEISHDLLINRSHFIRSIYDALELNHENELISSNFKNITLYKNFIENRIYDTDKLYDLYTIANYMHDCNINYLAEMIILHVKESKMDIDESFKYLDLLYTSICDEQLNILIYAIFHKYDIVDFLNKIMDKNLMLNNYIYKVLRNELEEARDSLREDVKISENYVGLFEYLSIE